MILDGVIDRPSPELLGLWMIVKDEADVIERCLLSVRDHIDRWTIIDTGSTDDTMQIVLETLDGIPGNYQQRPWVDYGHNRTEALWIARTTPTRWLLRMDADWTLEVVHPGLRDWLADDPDPDTSAWMVEVQDSGTMYRLPLLIRGSLAWRYVGVTHEYLDTSAVRRRSLLGLQVRHHSDGSQRADKHERDLRLLAAGVADGDPRAIFYSAQALHCLGRDDEAAAMYRRRAEMGGWEEERWYAQFQSAKISDDIKGLLLAFAQRPWRPEPLRAAAAVVSRDTRDDVLFVERGR